MRENQRWKGEVQWCEEGKGHKGVDQEEDQKTSLPPVAALRDGEAAGARVQHHEHRYSVASLHSPCSVAVLRARCSVDELPRWAWRDARCWAFVPRGQGREALPMRWEEEEACGRVEGW